MRDELRIIYYIIRKDMRAYYLKPPAISWGILFPAAMSLSFYLRNPAGFGELAPGLLVLTVLFSTTAMEAVVINFELRIGRWSVCCWRRRLSVPYCWGSSWEPPFSVSSSPRWWLQQFYPRALIAALTL